jgi:hypothetical protein
MSEKYLFQKITDMPEMDGTYRNTSFQFETEDLTEILEQFRDFLNASGFTYVTEIEAHKS